MPVTRNLYSVLRDFISLEQSCKAKQPLNSTGGVNRLDNLIKDIRDVVMGYQVRPQSGRSHLSNFRVRSRYNEVPTTKTVG